MNPVLLNVMEVYAKTEEAAQEARRGWIARGTTLDIMYDNIPNLRQAQLETKNYIYDVLLKIVYKFTA